MKKSRTLIFFITAILTLMFAPQVIYAEIPELVAHKTESAPKIDGIFEQDEWNSTFLNVKNGAPNTNTTDRFDENFTADVYTQWDDINLYICAVVTKEEHINDYTKEEMYLGDCLQVNIIPNWPELATGDGWNELGFMASTDFSRQESFRWYELGTSVASAKPYDDADFAIKRDGKNTIYEIAIPWKSVTPKGMVYNSGDMIGYAVAFTIKDEIGNECLGIEYANSMFSKNPSSAATLLLDGDQNLTENDGEGLKNMLITIVVITSVIVLGVVAFVIYKKKIKRK